MLFLFEQEDLLSLTDYITLGNSGLKVREGLFPAFSLSRELSREFSREKTREFVFRGETRINTGELETTRELAGKQQGIGELIQKPNHASSTIHSR